MNDLSDAFTAALTLIVTLDSDLLEIMGLSLYVTLSALAIAATVALPLGAAVALTRFPGRSVIITILNSLMGLPPVVVGLLVYLMLSRAGPLGELGILFTPAAMIVAQSVLVTPIVAALTRQTLEDLHREYDEQLRSLQLNWWQTLRTLLWEGRFRLLTAILAGFGRASAEVGAVMIVGGNINHVTRVMTTTIALETRKGDLALAMGLGLILIALVMVINGAAFAVNHYAERLHGQH